jgi:hypothetical protein
MTAGLLSVFSCVEEATIPVLGEQPVNLVVSVSAAEIHAGETDTITVTATNSRAEPATLSFNTLCHFRVYIRDARGRLMVPEDGDHGCVPLPLVLSLAPDSSFTRQFLWRGGRQFDPPGSSVFLPPGRYYVTADMPSNDYRAVAFAVRITILE